MEAVQKKRIALIASVTGCSVLVWWTAHRWLTSTGRFDDWRVFILPALATILLAAVAGLSFMLLRSRMDRVAATTAAWASFVLFFEPSRWYLTVLPVFLLLWWDGGRRIRGELDDRKRIRIPSLVGSGTKHIVLGVFLMVSLGFYLLPVSRTTDVAAVSRSIQGSFDTAYDLPIVQSQMAELPPSLQAQFRRDMARSVDQFVHKWLGPIAPYLPPLLALALFLGLWSLLGIIQWPASKLAAGMFMLLKAAGFVRMEEKDVKAHVISL